MATPIPPAPAPMNAAEIELALRKLPVFGRVLYVAAHPDDENTALIAQLANGALYDTAYLSLTRGDGGQNLIGPELREALGVIRTQELLAARRIDHGRQFFTRANDFGFSKSAEESLRIWDRDKILADVVWTIRRFQPDVIITRFAPDDKQTHGHHSASAQLAAEAFAISGDPTRFPEQLAHVKPWRATRLLWNTSRFFSTERGEPFDPTGMIAQEVGGFQPLLGRLFPEIAAQSRSMHKSQGFGVGADLGARREYFKLTEGPPVGRGVDLVTCLPDVTWQKVVGEHAVFDQLSAVANAYRAGDPAASVPALLQIRAGLAPLAATSDDPRVCQKLADLDRVIASCLGLHLVASTGQSAAHPGEALAIQVEAMYRAATPPNPPFSAENPVVKVEISNHPRLDVPVKLVALRLPATGETLPVGTPLVGGQNLINKITPVLPANLPYSQPYWLREPGTDGTYAVNDQTLIGLPENPPAFPVEVILDIGGQEVAYALDTRFRRVDPVAGEVNEPLTVTPPVFVELPRPVFVFGDDRARTVEIRLEASSAKVEGALALEAPAGWQVEPATAPIQLAGAGTTVTLAFKVTPPTNPKANEGTLRAFLLSPDGKRATAYGRQLIRYPHIEPQTLIPRAEAKLVRADIRNLGKTIGYVPGAGDAVPEALREIGADVKTLAYDDLNAASLGRFDAVVFGVRAFNTQPARFTAAMPALRAYAEGGGVVIIQYNTLPGPGEAGSLPFPLRVSRDRVTDETAEVRLLAPDHPLLNQPNRIGAGDFAGWVQERGLYFPDQWDPAWTPLLSCHDPGEKPMDGGLLVARCGKGAFIYTGYSWFRELPAGVPGAYRLFANLISFGKLTP